MSEENIYSVAKNNRPLLRDPYPSEDRYFKSNPKVSGMMTDDDRVILNPYSGLSSDEEDSVYKNESIRLYMRKNEVNPEFDLTDEQESFFKGTEYEADSLNKRRTLTARIIAGDPSAGKFTPEQADFAEALRKKMGIQ